MCHNYGVNSHSSIRNRSGRLTLGATTVAGWRLMTGSVLLYGEFYGFGKRSLKAVRLMPGIISPKHIW